MHGVDGEPRPAACEAAPDTVVRHLLEGLRLPVIVAPMFLVSGPDLVVEAVRAGLIGALPTLNARTSDILEQWLADIVARAANAPHSRWRGTWAANLIAHRTNPRLQADLDLLVRFRAPMVITALGSPRDVVDRVHDYGGLVLADVNSVAYARRAAEHGVDGLILVAHGAGGHTGRMNPFALVEAVRGFWDGLIVLAGGISTGRGVRAALELGVDLVSMGTLFIATRESLASQTYKDMVVSGGFDDIVCTDAFTGAPANMLLPSIRRAGLDPENLGPARKINVTEDPHSSARAWKDVWSAGHGIESIRSVRPLAHVVEALCAEFEDARGSDNDPAGQRERRP